MARAAWRKDGASICSTHLKYVNIATANGGCRCCCAIAATGERWRNPTGVG